MAGKTHWLSDKSLSLIRGATVAGFTETWVNLFKTLPTADSAAGVAASEEWTGGDGSVGSGGTGRIRVYPSQQADKTLPYWSSTQSSGDLRYVQNQVTISWTSADIPGGDSWANQTVRGIGVWNSDVSGSNDLLYWERFDDNRLVAVGEEFILPVGRFKVRED